MTELKQPVEPSNPIVFLDIQIGQEVGEFCFVVVVVEFKLCKHVTDL